VIVIGIDPGTAATGYGVVHASGSALRALDAGVIETASATPLERRLALIHERVAVLLDEHLPDAMAVEAVYFGQNARSALAVGHARGAALLAAGQRNVECASYTPQQVKGAVCGHGRAEKAQVQRMVARLLGLGELPRTDHAADALALAVCHLNRAPLMAALARA
jgi:crossover junction endodeoxyribonuclease RuvC